MSNNEIDEDEVLEKITLSGQEKKIALEECHDKLEDWGLEMPDVSPEILDFGLDRFYETGEIEFDVANNLEEGYCGKFIFMFEGQTCPPHHHNKKHETFFIVKGKINMLIEESDEIKMEKGDRKPIEQGTTHQFTAQEDSLILESSKPDVVDDSIFESEKINKIIFGKANPSP